MPKTLFVKSLPYEALEEQMDKMFEKFGKVNKANIIFDRARGHSKAFAFVEIADEKVPIKINA